MQNGRLTAAVFLLMPLAAAAADISVTGLFAGKAVVVIDGGRPHTLAVGETSPEGVKLISATSESAVIEYAGKRQQLTTGEGTRLGTVAGDSGSAQAALTADARGHFFATAAVNGISIRFIVDTGASLVTIGTGDAKRAGVNYLAGTKVMVQTANGKAPAYRVKFETVRLGDITLDNVDGIVVEGDALGGVGLLGLSFLNRTEMRRSGITMTLTKRY